MKLADALIEWEKAGDGAWLAVNGFRVFALGENNSRQALVGFSYNLFVSDNWDVVPPEPEPVLVDTIDWLILD